MDKHIIWFIDEDEHQRRTYYRELKRIMPESIQVEAIAPFRQKEDYLPLLANSRTAGLIIDQKLKDTGVATYMGIELAQYIRGINPKIPLYILTNFVHEDDEFTGGEWSVEDIIGKDELNDDEQTRIIQARLLRRIDIYEDILSQREQRFRNLLKKSLHDDFGDEERQELEQLQLERTSVTLASELAELQQLDKLVKAHQDLMATIKPASGREEKNVN